MATASATKLSAQAASILTKRREELGLSRRALARELDVADTTLLELETGRANPTLDRLEKVAAGYGLELDLKPRVVGGPS